MKRIVDAIIMKFASSTKRGDYVIILSESVCGSVKNRSISTRNSIKFNGYVRDYFEQWGKLGGEKPRGRNEKGWCD